MDKYIPMRGINILFVTFYGLIDYVADIVNAFENYANFSHQGSNFNVYEFSYLKCMNDEKLDPDVLMKKIITMINKNNITHLFWFFFPEQSMIMENIKKQTNVKYIFYNFDDPKSFNVFLVKKSILIDYFINPDKHNERKYTIIMDKQIYTVPLYISNVLHINDIKITNNDGDDLDNIIAKNSDHVIMNDMKNHKFLSRDETDVIIIADSDIVKYDMNELAVFDKYMCKTKESCLLNDYSIKLYGPDILEDEYPDIYVGLYDTSIEGYVCKNSKIIVLLDVRTGLDKNMNNIISRCISRCYDDVVNSGNKRPDILLCPNQINNIILFSCNGTQIQNVKIMDLSVDTQHFISINSNVLCNDLKINEKSNILSPPLLIDNWVDEIVKIITK